MIIRNNNGKLVEIMRYNFKNDKLYYEKIMEITKQYILKNQSSKLEYLTNSKEALNNKYN